MTRPGDGYERPEGQDSGFGLDGSEALRADALLPLDDDHTHSTSRFQALCTKMSAIASNPGAVAVLVILGMNQFLFATMHVLASPALEHIPPLAFACARMVLSLPLLGLVARWEWQKAERQGVSVEVSSKVVLWTVLCGAAGVAGAQMLVLLGNSMAGASLTAIVQPGIPVYTAVIAAVVGVERISWKKIVGVCLAVLGALVLLHVEEWGKAGSNSSEKSLGIIVLIVQTISYSCFMVMFSYTCSWFPHPFVAFFLCTLWSAIAMMCAALPDLMNEHIWVSIPWTAWGAVLYTAVMISFVAHTGQAWAIRHMRPIVPALFGTCQPPLTIGMAVLFLGEELELITDLTGMALIILGMLVVIYAKNTEGAVQCTGDGEYGQLGGDDLGMGMEMETEMAAVDEGGHRHTAPGRQLEVYELNPLSAAAKEKLDPFDTSLCMASTLRANAMSRQGSLQQFPSYGSRKILSAMAGAEQDLT